MFHVMATFKQTNWVSSSCDVFSLRLEGCERPSIDDCRLIQSLNGAWPERHCRFSVAPEEPLVDISGWVETTSTASA